MPMELLKELSPANENKKNISFPLHTIRCSKDYEEEPKMPMLYCIASIKRLTNKI